MSQRPIHLGYEAKAPLILGDVNKADPILVESTGLFMSLRKGQQRWVTGSAVQAGFAAGNLISASDSTARMDTSPVTVATAPAPAPEPSVGPVPPEPVEPEPKPAPKAAHTKAPAKKAAAKKSAPVKGS